MTIKEIAQAINETVLKSEGLLPNIQFYRQAQKGQKFRNNTLFGQKAVKEEEGYGYHHGGREELQYNIGFLEPGGKRMLYYGLALTFESSREVPKPLDFFNPHRQRLNDLIRTEPNAFKGLEMLHLEGEIRKGTRKLVGPYAVREITNPKLFDFYVIGKFAEVPSSPDDAVFQDIARTFEQLFPVYWTGTFNEELPSLELRLARLCYNSNHWVRPSGSDGKSASLDSYERRHGFGLEEWFFDLNKTIEGWHYAYLRPVDRFWKTYQGRRFDVRLYTRTTESQFAFVGEVRDLEVITPQEADRVLQIYEEKGWLKEMNDQVRQVGGIPNDGMANFFKVRFRPEKATIYDKWIPAEPGEIPLGRYIFFKGGHEPTSTAQSFAPRPPSIGDGEAITAREIERTIAEQKSFRKDIHTAIQLKLHEYLFNKYGNCTQPEARINDGGQRIDLKFQRPDGRFVLLEIKTYENDLRTCLRTALGQLLEYAYLDTDIGSESELIIVSQNKLDAKSREYLQYLRATRKLPVAYLQFDWKNGNTLDSIYCDNI